MFTTLYAGSRRSQTHTYARSLNFYREIGVWAVREWMTPLAATVAETNVDMTLT